MSMNMQAEQSQPESTPASALLSNILAKADLRNWTVASLVETSLQRREGRLAESGSLIVETGEHTGRSAKDKFVVLDRQTRDTVWWENAASMEPSAFDRLLEDFSQHANAKQLFRQDLLGGSDATHRIGVTVVTELAWHSLFIRNLLIRPNDEQIASFKTDLTIIDFPSFKANPSRHGCKSETVIACDFSRRIVLIGGTQYAGEMKKAVFTYLNFILPDKSVMPMHCSVNVGERGDSAIFFGLSGTGKTTLSADPSRMLVGDDEHGWGENGLFNFEGGCYAKVIRLSKESEPEIFAASQRFGTVLENVPFISGGRQPDFDDASATENTRSAYSIDAIPNIISSGRAGHPKSIFMLTCDAFGVLPPISKLTPEQAMAYFLAGYTAKVAGTERGIIEPQATFSACFGAPFMPRHPTVYANLLRKFVADHGATCWLVNTGWTGGPFGVGSRISLAKTRALLAWAMNAEKSHSSFQIEDHFGLAIPLDVPGFEPSMLNPSVAWENLASYASQATRLVSMFSDALHRIHRNPSPASSNE